MESNSLLDKQTHVYEKQASPIRTIIVGLQLRLQWLNYESQYRLVLRHPRLSSS